MGPFYQTRAVNCLGFLAGELTTVKSARTGVSRSFKSFGRAGEVEGRRPQVGSCKDDGREQKKDFSTPQYYLSSQAAYHFLYHFHSSVCHALLCAIAQEQQTQSENASLDTKPQSLFQFQKQCMAKQTLSLYLRSMWVNLTVYALQFAFKSLLIRQGPGHRLTLAGLFSTYQLELLHKIYHLTKQLLETFATLTNSFSGLEFFKRIMRLTLSMLADML